MEGRKATCEVLCLLPETAKRWVRDTLAEDVKNCIKVESSLTLPGSGTSVVTTHEVPLLTTMGVVLYWKIG